MLNLSRFAQGGRLIRGKWIFQGGTMKWVNDQNQGLGNKSCHQIEDVMAPGAAISRGSFADDPNKLPDDIVQVQQTVRQ